MKTYFIEKIDSKEVSIVVNSLKELAHAAIFNCPGNSSLQRLYVRCSHVVTGYGQQDEQNVEYIVRVNDHKRIITTKRI